MGKRIIGTFLAFLFLTGSFILPLGDFSLLRDIPGMYRDYSLLTTRDELGIIDFIGDYLMHGKDIFGHNAKDRQNHNSVQIQHLPAPLQVVFLNCPITLTAGSQYPQTHLVPKEPYRTSEYKRDLFRPPLA